MATRGISIINALTLAFSKEFATNGPEVFGVTPGFTTTDLNGVFYHYSLFHLMHI
jgi:hypothetical protein